jgi:hypothetical protein
LLGVIGVVLFPIWPYWLKYSLWMLSYYTVMAILGVIIVRLVIYTVGSIFGASVWVFPRLFDNVEVVESFRPFLGVSWWEGSNVYSIFTRILILAVFGYYGYHIYADPAILRCTFKDLFREFGDHEDHHGGLQ